MTSHNPLVTVGMPVYNGEPFLRQAISSVLAQDLDDLELVISDNGSTDGTPEICRDVVAKDPRVRYVRSEDNNGAAWNYNNVLRLARGTYFHWAASDDVFEPSFLNRCVHLLREDNGVVLAFSTTRVVDAEGQPCRPDWRPRPGYATGPRPADRFRDVLDNAGMCLEVFGLMRREEVLSTQGIQPFTSSDRALLGELALRGRFGHVDEPLFANRVHARDSVHAHPDPVERARWFHPAATARFPRWRLLRAYVGAASHGPGPTSQRLAALGVVAGWAWRRRAGLLFDLTRVLPPRVRSAAGSMRERRRAARAASSTANPKPPNGSSGSSTSGQS